jgi:hypothetical protein
MAPPRHNLTRRALLGAGVGACGVVAVPGAAAVGAGQEKDAARWARALDDYECAEAGVAAWRHHLDDLPPELRAYPACEPYEDRFDEAECARLAALRRLLRVPAPDLPALALKIHLFVDDQAWELTGAETCLARLKADANRLCHGG